MKNPRGITIISLIVAIVIMLILLSVSINIGTTIIRKAKLEDIKTDMLLLQSKVKVLSEKHAFGEAELSGIEIDLESDEVQYANEDGIYILLSGLRNKLNHDKQAAEENEKEVNYYIWTEAVPGISLEEGVFYVVDYESGEIYYSAGFVDGENAYYSLTELQEL